MRLTFFASSKSIVGTALAGLGIIILYQNLHKATAQLDQLVGSTREETFGVLPSLVLAASRVMQAYAFDHRGFLESFVLHVLVLFWPLLPVIVGTVLSQDAFTGRAEHCRDLTNTPQKKTVGMSILQSVVRRLNREEASRDQDGRGV
jgi:hypothetical protein